MSLSSLLAIIRGNEGGRVRARRGGPGPGAGRVCVCECARARVAFRSSFVFARFHTTATVPPVQASFWPRPPRHQSARDTRAGPPRGSLARPLPSRGDAERTTPTAASTGPGDELNRQTRATRNRTGHAGKKDGHVGTVQMRGQNFEELSLPCSRQPVPSQRSRVRVGPVSKYSKSPREVRAACAVQSGVTSSFCV